MVSIIVIFFSEDPILSAVTWANNDEVVAVWMNRVQNNAEIVIYNITAGTYETVLKISEPSGWIDLFTPPKFSQDGSRLVLIHPQDQGSGLGSYRHVTLVDRSSNTPVSLTSGQFVVTQIHSWDYEQGLM
uniref:Dipeptidylpeptidase IV N-terminal domain-containing protein n=1 Tax=Timema monikensis TaxID=170555 RepID=A0A7R9EKM2_9NEOP|nr:unnamed protein product [Timema monikensis]